MDRIDQPDLAALVARFESAWQQGPIPRIDTYLAEWTEGSTDSVRSDALVRLVLVDLTRRWQTADPSDSATAASSEDLPPLPRLEDYVRCFPELGHLDDLPLELICGEYRARCLSADRPSQEEYSRRFPTHADQLVEALSTIDRETSLAGDATVSFPDLDVDGSQATTAAIDEETASFAASATSPGSGASGAAELPEREFGDYELLEVIARGGMGIVYKARQRRANRIVALKMILQGNLAEPRDIERFYVEAEAAAHLDHPNIVPVYDVGEFNGRHFYSMAFVTGKSLAELSRDRPLAPRKAAELIVPIADAVAYAHQRQIIHRDLKPANILLDRSGVPRVTDFGLAKRIEGDMNLTATGQMVGTPGYMPPEQALGRQDMVGPVSDVYGLGAVLYHLLTGQPPFRAMSLAETLEQVVYHTPTPPSEWQPAVDRDLETIVLKALEKEPARRYASARELAADVQRYLEGRPILARRTSITERAIRWIRRNRLVSALVAAVLVAALLTGWQYRRASLASSKQVPTAVGAMSNSAGRFVPNALAELERLPREAAIAQLRARFDASPRVQQLPLAYALAHFGQVETEFLVDQVGLADAEEAANLIAALEHAPQEALAAIDAAIEVTERANWRHKARLAALALALGNPRLAEEMCRIQADPESRSSFIDECARWHDAPPRIVNVLQGIEVPHLRSAVCLSLGSLSQSELTPADKRAIANVIADWYVSAEDSGTHSAASWVLRTWDLPLPPLSSTDDSSERRAWQVSTRGFTMLRMPAGSYQMLNHGMTFPPPPPKDVTFDRPFLISDTEITVGLFGEFLAELAEGAADSGEKLVPWKDGPPTTDRQPDQPIEKVSWFDAVIFCNWLSRKEGFSCCYRKTGKKLELEDFSKIEVVDEWVLDPSANGYRLPTDAEWEYACRAGTRTQFACGNYGHFLRGYGVYSAESSAAVGSRMCNAWGLFDMHGNVREWCGEIQPNDATLHGGKAIGRGGIYELQPESCTSSSAYPMQPTARHNGFRVARNIFTEGQKHED